MRAPLILLVVGACQTPGIQQLTVFIDTDAPLELEKQTPGDPIPLFDALRLDVLPPNQTRPCAGCTRDLDVDAARFKNLSFGLAPEQPGYRVRARLYVRRFTGTDGEPNSDSTIDVTSELPPVGVGETRLTLFLATEEVGQALTKPIVKGAQGARVGKWPGAARTPCPTEPASDEACVPGGAFWMGAPDRRLIDNAYGWHRLVILSPFFLDKTEVTVKEMTSLAARWSGSTSGSSAADWCTSGRRDDLPVNCVPRSSAIAHCRARGRSLPTEAQLTYVIGGLANQKYPWGSEDTICRSTRSISASFTRRTRVHARCTSTTSAAPCVDAFRLDLGDLVRLDPAEASDYTSGPHAKVAEWQTH